MGIILFSGYALILCIMSFFSKKQTTSQDVFFVNARSTSSNAIAISIVTSSIGASATIGMIGLAYDVGMPAFWWLGSGALGLVVLGCCFANKIRASKAYTLSEIIASLLGKNAEFLSAIIIVFAWTAIVTSQLAACIFLLQALLGVNKLIALLLGCSLIALHTVLGGQGSIIRLDKFQVNLIIGGILALLIWGILYSPTTFQHIDFELVNNHFPLDKAFYFCLILGGSYIVCPMLYGRVLCANDEKTASHGVLLAAFLLAIMALAITIIGIYARGVVPPGTPADDVLITFISIALHPWLAKFIYLFLLCTVISSADSCLFAASSALSRHLLKLNSINANRYCSLFLMGAAVLLTFTNRTILDYLLIANNVYVCSIVIPVMLCLFFHKNSTSINQPIMLLGMILASALGIFASIIDQYQVSYLGLGTSLLFSGLSFIKR